MSAPYYVFRRVPGRYGWAIATPAGALLVVDGCVAGRLTRWEARQTCGLLGLTYTEDT